MKRLFLVVLSVFMLATAMPALAKTDITIPPGYTQDMFKDLSTDIGLGISYMPLAPAEPLGGVLPHVDLGVEVTGVKIDTDKVYWKLVEQAAGNTLPSFLPMPKLHVQVGLPVVPIDLGFVYATVPTTNVKYMGGEVKYAILEGGVIEPALALRAAYTKLSGVSELDINTKSLDLSISKGFAIFTPYAGYGLVWIDSKPQGPTAEAIGLQEEKITEGKGYVGCKITFFPLMNLVAEADLAKVNAYSLRLNLHF